MNFKEHPYEVGPNGVVGKTNNETNKLVVAYGKLLKIMRLNPATNENNCLLEINAEMKTSLAERIGENLDH